MNSEVFAILYDHVRQWELPAAVVGVVDHGSEEESVARTGQQRVYPNLDWSKTTNGLRTCLIITR